MDVIEELERPAPPVQRRVVTLGIDLGASGALAAIGGVGGAEVIDLPTYTVGTKTRVDGKALCHRLRDIVPRGPVTLRAFYEDVRVMPKMGGRKTSADGEDSLVHARGVVEAVLRICGIEGVPIQPTTWQRHYGLKGKGTTMGMEGDAARAAKLVAADAPRQLAIRLFPSLADELSLKKFSNRADAVLIAHWGHTKGARQ